MRCRLVVGLLTFPGNLLAPYSRSSLTFYDGIGCPEVSVTNYQSTPFKILEQCKSHLHSGKGKAVPLQAWTGPEGSRGWGFQISRQSAHVGGKVVSPMHWLPLPSQEIFLVLISVIGWVDPRATVRPEGLWKWKIPVTPSGIEPVTYQLVNSGRTPYFKPTKNAFWLV